MHGPLPASCADATESAMLFTSATPGGPTRGNTRRLKKLRQVGRPEFAHLGVGRGRIRPAHRISRRPVALSTQTRRWTSQAAIGDLPGMNQPFTVCGQFGPAIMPETAQRSTCRKFKSGVQREASLRDGAGSRARNASTIAKEQRRRRRAPHKFGILRAIEISDPDHQHIVVEHARAPRVAIRKRRAGFPRDRPRFVEQARHIHRIGPRRVLQHVERQVARLGGEQPRTGARPAHPCERRKGRSTPRLASMA